MSQFLSIPQAFDWSEANQSRSSQIQHFKIAYGLAKENKDRLYHHPEFYSVDTPSLDIYLIVWQGYDLFKEKFPWATVDDFSVLMGMPSEFHESPAASRTPLELQQNTGDRHCSWIAPRFDWSEEYVYDKPTFDAFHLSHVISLTRQERLEHPEYFKKHFRATLLLSFQTISDGIHRGDYNPAFERIDRPTLGINGLPLHGEQVHIHFTDGAALNIDGTWKHGTRNLDNDICETLIIWGFLLPENV